eukprot:5202725-Lingulodinium_polyedra.AAC.1
MGPSRKSPANALSICDIVKIMIAPGRSKTTGAVGARYSITMLGIPALALPPSKSDAGKIRR